VLFVSCNDDTALKPAVNQVEISEKGLKINGEMIEDIEDLEDFIKFQTYYAEKMEKSKLDKLYKSHKYRSELPPDIVLELKK